MCAQSYGPWTITDEVLYRKMDVCVVGTTEPDYVLKLRKISHVAHDELGALMMIRRHSLSYAIDTPLCSTKFCGMTDTHIWYVMRRYAGHVSYNEDARRSWKRIAQDVLAFLTQLHRSCHLVHMDIKVTNILANHSHTRFVVSDYELCDTPDRRLTRDYSPDFRYYYMAVGADLDQPLVSWRMDLTALGYILAEMSWNTSEMLPRTTFQRLMYERRDAAAAVTVGPRDDPSGDVDLIALREREMLGAHPAILGYLRFIKERLPWDMEAPPPESFYRELLTFFL